MSSHLSAEQVSAWITGERSREVEQHVQTCTECATEVAQLQDALLLFRDSGDQISSHWRSQPKTPESHHIFRWAAGVAVLATVVLTTTFVPRKSDPLPELPQQEVFVRIPYVAPLAPYERTEVVRMDLPVAALIAAGFRMDTASAADSVTADVLVGQDGRALAVGFPENKYD